MSVELSASEKMGCVGLIVLLGMVTMCGCGGCLSGCGETTYGEGYRDGYVRKVSTGGYIWKTTEGYLVVPRVVANGEGGVSVGVDWGFTVHDPDVISELEQIGADELVRLHYRQVMITTPWNGSTDYRITKVEKRHK